MPVSTVPTAGLTSPIVSPTITGAVFSSMASSVITSGTAVASTSGTSIDFTGIPSWVKRITVMFNGVSHSTTSSPIVQIGSGSIVTTGYISTSTSLQATPTATASTSGFVIRSPNSADTISGSMVLMLVSGNVWVSNHTVKISTSANAAGGGDLTLGGTLDRLRITMSNGTDTFTAGSINILYE